MAEEISNKTLAVIVVAAIVVTLGSTALIMRMGSPVITGMAITDAGTATFNITGVVAIDVIQETINFGSGTTEPGVSATLISGTAGGTEDGLTTQGTWANYSGPGFVIENDGNVNINVTVSSDVDADAFISGTSPSFQWVVDTTTDNGESETVGCITDIGSWGVVSTTVNDTLFCGNMPFGDDSDSAELDIKLVIPHDAPPQQTSATITFEAFAY